jgi:hypothetical protein
MQSFTTSGARNATSNPKIAVPPHKVACQPGDRANDSPIKAGNKRPVKGFEGGLINPKV